MKQEDKIIADNLYDEEIEQRIKSGQIIDTGLCNGRTNEKPMTNEQVADWLSGKITIDESVFSEMMKLIYMFVPKEELARMELMIDKRNNKLKSYLYSPSLK